jgi:hypothetical protein
MGGNTSTFVRNDYLSLDMPPDMKQVQVLLFTGLKAQNSNCKLMGFFLSTNISITPLVIFITAQFKTWRCVSVNIFFSF